MYYTQLLPKNTSVKLFYIFLVTTLLSWYLSLTRALLLQCFGFRTDSEKELLLAANMAKDAGAFDAVACTNWADGGAGAVALAKAVSLAAEKTVDFKFLYELDVSLLCLN